MKIFKKIRNTIALGIYFFGLVLYLPTAICNTLYFIIKVDDYGKSG